MAEPQTKAILVVEDEESMREMLSVALRKWGYRTVFAKNLKEAIAAVERGRIDLILSDIKLPDGSGVDVLSRIKSLPEQPPVVFMTAFGNTESAVQAMNMGAFYYITKPFKLEELQSLLEKAAKSFSRKKTTTPQEASEEKRIEKEKPSPSGLSSMFGTSKPMRELKELIERVSNTKTNILITGESGTGKELVARAIHYSGLLKDKAFVAVNCGAIPENLIESELFGHKRGSFTGAVSDKEGLFQVASDGTIFLDEVGELPMTMQVKLLRVLQDRTLRPVGGTEDTKINVRVISATNRNLEEAIVKGKFREDLYYRLNVINIKTPPLRDRNEDIPTLVEHFIQKYSVSHGKQVTRISPIALEALMQYPFPGNVRELENVMERAVALEGSSEIMLESLPIPVQKSDLKLESEKNKTLVSNDFLKPWEAAEIALSRGSIDLEKMVAELEKEYILKALEKAGGVKKKAAQLLGLTFRSMRYRITKYGIHDTEGEVEE